MAPMIKTCLITHPDCNQHRLDNHPERPERLLAVMERLEQSGLMAEMEGLSATEISDHTLQLVHPQNHINQIEQAGQPDSTVRLDPDTYMSEGSNRAARLAAGAVAEATERVLSGASKRSFCAVRPPGHHAEIAAALGFCLFNNIAVGARLALDSPGIGKVAILDFDVHHCNGTVDIFKEEERVLVCSSFQENFYPYRYLDFQNDHIRNTPLPAGTKGHEFRNRIEKQWLPAIESYKPDMIFVSAGFDAHKDDPLAGLKLDKDDFRWITRMIADLADNYSEGRIVSTLEGGYDLRALADSVEVFVEELIL